MKIYRSVLKTINSGKRGWDRTVLAENEEGEENPVDFLLLLSFYLKSTGFYPAMMAIFVIFMAIITSPVSIFTFRIPRTMNLPTPK